MRAYEGLQEEGMLDLFHLLLEIIEDGPWFPCQLSVQTLLSMFLTISALRYLVVTFHLLFLITTLACGTLRISVLIASHLCIRFEIDLLFDAYRTHTPSEHVSAGVTAVRHQYFLMLTC